MIVLAIDPSLVSLGFAVAETIESHEDLLCPRRRISAMGYIKQHTDKGVPYHLRALEMVNKFADAINLPERWLFDRCVIEVPNNWFTEKGQGSKDSESIQKLYFFCGALVAKMCSYADQVEVVTPMGWKGQTPKPIIIARVKALGIKVPEHTPHDTYEAAWLAYKATSTSPALKTTVVASAKAVQCSAYLGGEFTVEWVLDNN